MSLLENITPFEWFKLHFQRDFCAGGLAGSVGIFVGYPFDLIKLRLQNDRQLRSLSAFQCFQKIIHDNGLQGLYRGCLPPICAQGFINALIFFGDSYATSILEPALKSGYLSLTSTQCIAGSFGGLLSCSILVPSEVIKCSLQAKKGAAINSSLWLDTVEEFKTLYRTEGVRGFFKGFTITAYRQIPSMAIYFYAYKKFRSLFASTRYVNDDIAIAISGGCAGCISWVSTYPLDVIKTNIQLSPLESSSTSSHTTTLSIQVPRKSVFQVAMALYRMHGFPVFYRGVGVCVLRAFPVNCVTFYLYEYLKRHISA
jgi:solute carrier family 25 carnitine/acylcarnitine transporter 20/29